MSDYIHVQRRFDVGKPVDLPYEEAVLYHDRHHPFCQVMPPADRDGATSLARSLFEIGQIEPVAFWRESKDSEVWLVDGRHRILLLQAQGKKYKAVLYTCPEDDIIAWIWAMNGARRQMDVLERAKMELAFRKRLGSGSRVRPAELSHGNTPGAMLEAAERKGAPELIKMLEAGEIKLDVAAKVARRLNTRGQLEFVAQVQSGVAARQALDRLSREVGMTRSTRVGETRPIAAVIHVELRASEAVDRYGSGKVTPARLIEELQPVVDKLRKNGFRVDLGVSFPRHL